MAVMNLSSSQLRLKLETGYDPSTGDATYKTKSFSNVYVNAQPSQLLAVAKAFASLQTFHLSGVERFDKSEIYEQ